MRRFLMAVSAAAVAIGVAAPASAQWFPQAQAPGYGNDYGNYGGVRSLRQGLDGLHRHIDMLRSRNLLTHREARLFHIDVRETEVMLARYMRGGLTAREANLVRREIGRLARRVEVEASNNRRNLHYDYEYDEHYDYEYGSPYGY